MSKKYDAYLKEHIENVQKAFELLKPHLIQYSVITEKESEKIKEGLKEHDKSKYGKKEYDAYDVHFFGSNYDKIHSKNDFDVSWLHHIHTNPHHWQHWVVPMENIDGTDKAVEMPLRYVIEMVCDWWSFGLAKNKPDEILSWYETNKNKMLLHVKTKILVSNIMYLINTIIVRELKK